LSFAKIDINKKENINKMLQINYTTNIGDEKFKNNQDSVLVDEYIFNDISFKDIKNLSLEKQKSIFAVADGISASRYSQVVSGLSLKYLREFFSQDNFIVKKAIFEIQNKLENLSFEKRYLQGASTTLAGVVIDDNKATIFNVGDSRVYILRDKILSSLTNDHTQKYNMLKNNEIYKDEFDNLSDIYNMLENYLVCGEFDELFVEIKKITLGENDLLFICTDGVSDSLDDVQINSYLVDEDYKGLFNIVKKTQLDNFSFIAIKL
jgi:protein phosphatase